MKQRINFQVILLFITYCIVGISSLGTYAATNVTIDDLNYSLYETGSTAAVIGMNVDNIVDLVIPDFVEYSGKKYLVDVIYPNAFENCSGLTGSLTIGDNIEYIGKYAFYNCNGLTGSLIVPDKVEYIGEAAFMNCSSFTGSLSIPDGITRILDSTFYGCSGLTESLDLPANVMEIGDQAFYQCSGLSGSLIVPDNVKKIGLAAFEGCRGFNRSLSIGKNVEIIGARAFFNCSGLTGSLILPEKLSVIENFTFGYCHGFNASLTIPDNVIEIKNFAFQGCRGFTDTLTIGKKTTTIGEYAFMNCDGLLHLYLPECLTKINNNAFCGCKFSSVTCDAVEPPTISKGLTAFDSETCANAELIVPAPSINAYKTAFNWKDFIHISAPKVQVSGISLEKNKMNLRVSETVRLLATVSPADAADKTIVWTTSNPEIATVGDDGQITAVNVGEAIITATTTNGLTAQCEVTVNPRTVVLNCESLELHLCDTFQLVATLEPEPETMSFSWSSTNPEVVTVNSDGIVTPVSPGEAEVVATEKSGSSASCIINVPTPSLTLNADKVSLHAGETFQLKATVQSGTRNDFPVTYSSENDEYVSVSDDGLITVNKHLYTKIGVYVKSPDFKDLKETCWVSAPYVPITGVLFSCDTKEIVDNTLTLRCGERVKINTSILPENATDKNITLTLRSEGDCIEVEEGNILVAKKEGEGVLSANNSSFVKPWTLKVKVISPYIYAHDDHYSCSVALNMVDTTARIEYVGNLLKQRSYCYKWYDYDSFGSNVKEKEMTYYTLPDYIVYEDKRFPITEIGNEYQTIFTSTSLYRENSEFILPKYLKKIGKYAFKGKGITSVIFNDTLEEIEESAFEDCKNLMYLDYYGNPSLDHYIDEKMATVDPESYGVTNIFGDISYEKARNLKSLNFPKSLKAIGDKAFFDCINMGTNEPELIIPGSVTFIGEEAFHIGKKYKYSMPGERSDCGKYVPYIREVTLESGDEPLELWLHNGIHESYLPDYSMVFDFDIGRLKLDRDIILTSKSSNQNRERVFNKIGHSYDNSVQLGPNVSSIFPHMFTQLSTSEINLPKNLRMIGRAFDDALIIKNVDIEDIASYCNIVSGVYPGKFVVRELPSGPVSISGTFTVNGKEIHHMVIPSHVNYVTGYAFQNARNLSTIRVDCDTIYTQAFSNCVNVTSLCLDTQIIGSEAFSGMSKLREVYCLSTIPPEADMSIFSSYSDVTLYVPRGCVETYRSALPWKYFTNIVESDFDDLDEKFIDDVKGSPTGIISVKDSQESEIIGIYSLEGIKVADSKENLTPGLYIIVEKDRRYKIQIK